MGWGYAPLNHQNGGAGVSGLAGAQDLVDAMLCLRDRSCAIWLAR